MVIMGWKPPFPLEVFSGLGSSARSLTKILWHHRWQRILKKIKHRENAKASLYKCPGKSILNVNHVFLVRPICSVSGISFQRYLPNVSPNSMTQKMKSLHMFIFVKKLEVVHKYVGGCLITPDWLLKRSWGLSDWIFANVHVDLIVRNWVTIYGLLSTYI